jgi:triosephosphate isomerase
LPLVRELLSAAGDRFALGAQDLHGEDKGAYTGEIAGPMLAELGCRYVLVGHSERRTYFHEAGPVLLGKLRAALRGGLVPILCIGERLEEREAGRTEDVLAAQLEETLFQLGKDEAARVVLAYEPVWAIGTGRNATPEQAEEAHRFLRGRVGGFLDLEGAERCRILYGGSVQGANAASLLARPGVDGALVGGASLKAGEFLSIVQAASRATASSGA